MKYIEGMWNDFVNVIVTYLPDLGGALIIAVIGILITSVLI